MDFFLYFFIGKWSIYYCIFTFTLKIVYIVVGNITSGGIYGTKNFNVNQN